MELFPAQPDLSLQISPPTSKPTSKTWRTSSTASDQDHHDLDLGNLWKRAFNSQKLHQQQQQQQQHGSTRRPEPSFGLSLSNPNIHSKNSDLTHFHNLLSTQNTNTASSNRYPYQHHQNHHQPGFSSELGFLRPIRGIPVYYQNTPPNFPIMANPHHKNQPSFDSCTNSTTTSSLIHSNNINNIVRSRFLSSRLRRCAGRLPFWIMIFLTHNFLSLQDQLMKSILDSIFKVGFGFDLDTLSGSDEVSNQFMIAFDDSNCIIFWRYVDVLWRIKRYFNIGSEATLKKNIRVIDNFMYGLIEHKGSR